MTSAAPPPARPLGVVSSHDQIAGALARDILGGRWTPGEKLPMEAELLQRFGVSRTALREALKTLAAKGFLSVKTRVGTRITDPLHWNFFDKELLSWRVALGMHADFRRDLVDVRRAMEPAAAALAAERRTDADLVAMRRAIAAMRAETASDYGFARADLELHVAIGAASQNPMMRSFASVIETALLEAFTLSPPTRTPNLHRDTVDAHERIIDCIDARNPNGASAAMLAVIDAGHHRVEAECERD